MLYLKGRVNCLMKNRQVSPGFTILEVLIVLSLLTLVVSIAVLAWPSLESWSLQSAADELAVHLREARVDAIASGKHSEVVFYLYANCYALRFSTGTHCIELPAGINYFGTTTFPGTPPSVYFNYKGRPSSGGTVTLESRSGGKYYIIMAPVTGRVRLSREPPEYW